MALHDRARVFDAGVALECGLHDVSGLGGDAGEGAENCALPPRKMQRRKRRRRDREHDHDDERAHRAFHRFLRRNLGERMPSQQRADDHAERIGERNEDDRKDGPPRANARHLANEHEIGQQFADVENGEQRVGSTREVALLFAVHADPERGDHDAGQQHAFPAMQQIEGRQDDIPGHAEHRHRIDQRLALNDAQRVELVKAHEPDRQDQEVERPRHDDACQPDDGQRHAEDDAAHGDGIRSDAGRRAHAPPKRRSRL